MNITLQSVTIENWRALVKLQVREDQKHFVAANVYSIAEAQFGFDYEGHWGFQPFGIYDGDTPVGFLMYGFNFRHPTCTRAWGLWNPARCSTMKCLRC